MLSCDLLPSLLVHIAIDDGFGQAKEILSGLKVLQGDIAAGVENTYELIQSGLAKFKSDMLPSSNDLKE